MKGWGVGFLAVFEPSGLLGFWLVSWLGQPRGVGWGLGFVGEGAGAVELGGEGCSLLWQPRAKRALIDSFGLLAPRTIMCVCVYVAS